MRSLEIIERNMKIVGYIEIRKGVLVTPDCLNKSFEANINGVKCQLLTPSLPKDFAKDEGNSGGGLVQPNSEIQFKEDAIYWGRSMSWPEGQSNLDRLMLEFDYDNPEQFEKITTLVKEGIEDWIYRFHENFFGIGLNLESPNIRVKGSAHHRYDFYYRPTKEEKPIRALEKAPDHIEVYMHKPVTLIDFKTIIKVTSENKRLILEYQLLREAHQAIMTDNYRKSILDSASALEVSLTNVIKRDIRINEDLLNEILKMNNSISKKRRLIKYTKYELPEHNYQKDVEELRNRAIHIGKDPTSLEARTAYKIVKEVVDSLTTQKFE